MMTGKRLDKVLPHPVWLAVFMGLLLLIAPSAWADEASQEKEIRVFIERQVLSAFENGEEVYSFDIVTGRDGKETTAGRYRMNPVTIAGRTRTGRVPAMSPRTAWPRIPIGRYAAPSATAA